MADKIMKLLRFFKKNTDIVKEEEEGAIPICGFKDTKGYFHDTEKEALDASKRYRLEENRQKVVSRYLDIVNELYKKDYSNYYWIKPSTIERVLDLIMRNPQPFLEYMSIINK